MSAYFHSYLCGRKAAEWLIDMDQIKTYLSNDKRRIDALAEGDKVTKQAILALLGHGIDGNNVDAMIKSKDDLEKYLIKNI